jgi:hypothetical protein
MRGYGRSARPSDVSAGLDHKTGRSPPAFGEAYVAILEAQLGISVLR